MERFIGVITEHFAGAFPVWLSPVQVKVLPITDRTQPRCRELVELLENLGFRAEGDYRNEKIGYKIREAQMQKVPYMLVIGDKEAESGDLSVRTRSGEQFNMTVDEFIARLRKEVDEKTV